MSRATPLDRAWRCILLALVLLTSSCGEVCENGSPIEIESPDAELGAWIFLRDCGAAAAPSVHVSILPAGSPAPSEAGNTFIIQQGGSVSVDWVSPSALRITHEGLGQILEQEREVTGVAVSYVVE